MAEGKKARDLRYGRRGGRWAEAAPGQLTAELQEVLEQERARRQAEADELDAQPPTLFDG